ncbi:MULTISPECIES: lasso peptide biosynthesis PqqD family chaperone [unclassified Streptomyces]|uniref:lasso peptide biosynthesis PqqD family chaperone n=1 Tax=unclassified Streptomyces TaxID=2593676 RepID=UPI001BEC0DD4|nr:MULTISPECIES: lasso peptide biosynthesis PqqD family chaperone [unclassified Streptomyces]MBT2404947.1 lasso peptide biosynthesis PqqD family chaperone [Streptomyces sp. ISL-21]MBT2459376.1 lasso peptide biosynthesis PqqD family chaperone [Streptomyces sp. ISL-86]MBT2610673.1 lasso peptide biosynthesis PqqD family chaperone [Streptomyces sp. ISL-87]
MLTLKPGVLLTETEYGLALLDQDSAEYWTLNPTAAIVLRSLLDGGGPERAVEILTTRYEDVDTELAAEDVRSIIGELRDTGLLIS